jgi:hypothetical protein
MGPSRTAPNSAKEQPDQAGSKRTDTTRTTASPASKMVMQAGPPAVRLGNADGATVMAMPATDEQNSAGYQGDQYEREADQAAVSAAHSVASTPTTSTRSQQGGPESAPAPSGHAGLGAGRPLSQPVRAQFETAFGWNFSGVRLHTGGAAARQADSAGAKAFTSGRDIVFGSKVSTPESGAHRHVLAHELAHVVQQGKRAAPAQQLPAKQSGHRPLSASLSAAPAVGAQGAPLVTAVNSPGELGVGRSIAATATVGAGPAAATALTWTLVGAPAGVTVTPSGRRGAIIRANAASIASAGAAFNVQAALTATPGDNAQRATPINLVGITAMTFTANPALVAVAGVAAPANSAEPNRGGLAGNTATAVITIAPVARPAGTTVTLPKALGATAVLTTITPGTQTGNATVRATDNATGTFLDAVLIINNVTTALNSLTAPAAAGAPYGVVNRLGFAMSDTTGGGNRVIGETITGGGRDDFALLAVVNLPGGPNPAPILGLAAPANAATDTLGTPAGAAAGAAGDANLINVNRYVGPGVAATLPRMTIFRQGFNFLSWTGALWSDEFDLGMHRRSLRQVGAGFGFLSEQIFPKARASFPEAYVGPPLITLSAVTANPLVPAAAAIAADGVATGNVTVVSTVGARRFIWRVMKGNIATVPPGAAPIAGGAAGAAGAAVTVRAGLVPGNYTLRAEDSVFANRRIDGTVRVVAVNLSGMNAPVRRVPAGTLAAVVNVLANPGGRAVNWIVDPRAAAAGVTVVAAAAAGPAAALPARTATVTRPAGFTGNVTVTAADNVRPAARASIVITFL